MDFMLKKLVSAALMPIPIVIILILIGLFLARRYPKVAVLSQFGGIFILLALSSTWGANQMIQPLENQFGVWQPNGRVDYIHVLGSGHHSQPDRLAQHMLSETALARLIEGVRIWHLNPDATLIVSGYRGLDSQSHASLLKQAAMDLGVPEIQIVTFPSARDTREEAQLSAELVASHSLVLVTSASHMNRSMNEFVQAGILVQPAPTGFIGGPSAAYRLSGSNLMVSERAWHEYVGLLWQSMR